MRRLITFLSCFIVLSIGAQKYSFVYHMDKNGKYFGKDDLLLDVSGQKSVFRSTSEKKSDSLLSLGKISYGNSLCIDESKYVVKDLSKNSLYRSIVSPAREIYTVNIDSPLKWKILPDKEKFENYEVQKAEVDYGGRHWTAWFTQQIPISEGPYIFHGLPGLIVKIMDDKDEFSFVLTQVKFFDGNFFEGKKGIAMNTKQFQKIAKDYYEKPSMFVRQMNRPIAIADEKGNIKKVSYDEYDKFAKDNLIPSCSISLEKE